MGVQFILGRSGTGKTSLCIESIIGSLKDTDSAQPLVLLVPEQATYQAERAILANHKIAGFSRLSVLSFDRLKYLLLGKNASTSDISRLGQQMILQKILAQNAGKLKIYKNSAHLPGLAAQLTQTIIELHEADKDFSDIAELTENLKNQNAHLAALKFADIATIMQEYLNFIESAFTNPDILLTEARTKIADSPLLKNARIWVDGFASFTTQQLLLLVELMQTAENTSIALCLDPAAIDLNDPQLEPTSIFNQTERTYENLIEIIKKRSLILAEPKILSDPLRFTNCTPLAHIEANIFQPSQHDPIQSGSAIKITPASNGRAEVANTARQITDLIRNKNYRFRDIAVIVSDMTAYQHYIEATFGDYGIEFFIDCPKPMLQHPAVELIASALSAVTANFPSSDIFAYLKTDLANLTRAETDTLENYCLAYGVDTSDWIKKQDWDFAAASHTHFDEKKINDLRKKSNRTSAETEKCPQDQRNHNNRRFHPRDLRPPQRTKHRQKPCRADRRPRKPERTILRQTRHDIRRTKRNLRRRPHDRTGINRHSAKRLCDHHTETDPPKTRSGSDKLDRPLPPSRTKSGLHNRSNTKTVSLIRKIRPDPDRLRPRSRRAARLYPFGKDRPATHRTPIPRIHRLHKTN